MFEEMRFAIKCGGSAKKVQLSGSTAVPLKKLSKIKKSASESSHLGRTLLNQSGSIGNMSRKDCKKCEEIIRTELLDNITADNAIVCKHNSSNNLSIHNPGLLIVDKDTTLDAQAAILNSHMLPHSHMHASHQQASNQLPYHQSNTTKKSSPKSKQNTNPQFNYNNNNNNTNNNSEYILMQNFNKPSIYNKPQSSSSSHYLANQQPSSIGSMQSTETQEIPITLSNRFDGRYQNQNVSGELKNRTDGNTYASKSGVSKMSRYTDSNS